MRPTLPPEAQPQTGGSRARRQGLRGERGGGERDREERNEDRGSDGDERDGGKKRGEWGEGGYHGVWAG